MNIITYDKNTFLRGSSSSDFINDGGLSPVDKGQNLYVQKGLLYPGLALEETGDSLEIFSWAEAQPISTLYRVGMGLSTNDGKFYSIADNDSITLSATDTGHTYSRFYSDMIEYNGKFYATSTTDIAEFNHTLTTTDFNWWDVTKAQEPLNVNCGHHMVEYEGKLYIANGQYVCSYDALTDTVNDSALTLPTGTKITTMCNFNNRIYIATEPYTNNFGNKHGQAKLIIWDGASTVNWDESYVISDKAVTLYPYNGILYVFTPRYLAYWNGVRLVYLRDLHTSIQKGMVTTYRNRLYFIQNNAPLQPLSYDQISVVCFDGQAFSFPLKGASGLRGINCTNTDTLFVSTATKLYTADLERGTASTYHRFNREDFGQNVYIRKMIVELGDTLVTDSSMTFSFYDHKGVSNTIGTMTYAEGSRYYKEFKNINITTLSFQLRVFNQTNAKPIKRITIYYEPTEHTVR